MCSSDFPHGDPSAEENYVTRCSLDVKFLIDHNSHIDLTK
jgi:hypothetical protein